MLKPMPKGVFISIEELYGIVAFLIVGDGRAQHHRPGHHRRRRLWTIQ